MTDFVHTRCYLVPDVCRREILRYAGCREETPEIGTILDQCLGEALPLLSYQVCWRILPVEIRESICDFGLFSVTSQGLSKNLRSCGQVILMAATVGTQIDRLIAKYGHLSPSKAVFMQAIGAERIESLCDTFCQDIIRETGQALRPRFSPGYGDLPLSVQEDIFHALDCPRKIGLTLGASLLMSPSKSVTAFAGITGQGEQIQEQRCSLCHKIDCQFRGAT